jgi:parvulin-like peptidyl-prolyl isomerase
MYRLLLVWGCLSLVAASISAQAKPPANVAATVNGESILLEEVDTLLKRHAPIDAPLTGSQNKQLRTEVLNDLIDERLIRQFAQKHGPKIPPADIERYWQGLQESLRKQKKSLAEHLRETSQTEQQIRDGWVHTLQLQRLIDRQATETELKKYFEANREFFEKVTVRAAHIVIRISPTMTPGERVAATEKLRQLRTDILAGKMGFEAAAKKHSICPSAIKGGDMGFIARKDTIVDETFAAAAFALKKGEISEPVETEFGLHLILATDRTAAKPTTYEKSAELVREIYSEEVRQNLASKLRKDASIQITLP